MILIDLFESRMSELDIEYQDWKNLEPVAFYSRYKMSKDQWASKHWSLIKGGQTMHEQGVAEEQVNELDKSTLASYIKKAAPDRYNRIPNDLMQMKDAEKNRRRWVTREKGIDQALTKLSKEGVTEGAMKDLHTELAEKYRELAPSIEKHKDSYLAGQLYDALEAIAIEHGAELELKRMMTGARNRAHMDYDTNPGGFQNWFWYLPFADEQLDEKQDACYHKVKSRYKVWPSAYASGALVQCRKKGAANWGNKTKK